MGVTETIVKQVNTQTHEKSEVLNVDTSRVVFVSKLNLHHKLPVPSNGNVTCLRKERELLVGLELTHNKDQQNKSHCAKTTAQSFPKSLNSELPSHPVS